MEDSLCTIERRSLIFHLQSLDALGFMDCIFRRTMEEYKLEDFGIVSSAAPLYGTVDVEASVEGIGGCKRRLYLMLQ